MRVLTGREKAMHSYAFRGLFSLRTNIPYFEGLLHAFRNDQEADIEFRFLLDDKLEIETEGKPRINLMLYHNADSNAVELSYPWLRPISARLVFGGPKEPYEFRFNRNYLRFSNIIAEGWEIIDVFRSLLMIALIQADKYMIHGAALGFGQGGVLIPSFGNTGKTTTTWMLAKKGAEFLTDEFAILDSDGYCYGFPCSSLMSSSLVSEFGLKLSLKDSISLGWSELKAKMLTTRLAPGGRREYPDRHFKVCDKARINRLIFIQNGIDRVETLGEEEAVAMIKAIQGYELNWRSNPYVIAQSFFRPDVDFDSVTTREDALIRRLVARIPDRFLVSSTGTHFEQIEKMMRPPLINRETKPILA